MGASKRFTPAAEETAVEDDQFSTSQESVPVPLFAGERKIAVKWISPVYGQRAVEAADRPAKK
jgi:hypothetical protein